MGSENRCIYCVNIQLASKKFVAYPCAGLIQHIRIRVLLYMALHEVTTILVQKKSRSNQRRKVPYLRSKGWLSTNVRRPDFRPSFLFYGRASVLFFWMAANG